MKNVEVEIQAVIKEPEKVELELIKIGKFNGSRKQVDKYFVLPQKDFFDIKDIPDEYLRIRYEQDRSHLNYSFLHFESDGWLDSTDEYETLVQKPEIVEEIFKRIGLINKITVKKTRKYFDCGDFEVVLDCVENLGNFMEIEAKKDFGGVKKTRKACHDFMAKLNIECDVQKEMGYPRMLYKKLRKNK